jgi:AcrR family transcriptional regulator
MTDTQEKILDTAERLIGEQGYASTSLRQIINEAGVNLAAVHYHFGSKEELLDAVVLRKAGPVNEARLAALNRVEQEAGDGPLEVEKVLDSFFAPTAETAERNPQFVRLMGRVYSEGLMPQIVQKHFRPAMGRFLAALHRALPDLPQEELMWRVHFMVGAMAHTMCVPPVIPGVFDVPTYETASFAQRMKRLVAFLSAGFRAPVAGSEEK